MRTKMHPHVRRYDKSAHRPKGFSAGATPAVGPGRAPVAGVGTTLKTASQASTHRKPSAPTTTNAMRQPWFSAR